MRSLRDSAFRVEGTGSWRELYGAAVMAAGGDVILKGVRPSALKLPLALFPDPEKVTVSESSGRLQATGIGCEKEGKDPDQQQRSCRAFALKTGPYPEFPTDLQSPVHGFSGCRPGREPD